MSKTTLHEELFESVNCWVKSNPKPMSHNSNSLSGYYQENQVRREDNKNKFAMKDRYQAVKFKINGTS